MSNGKGPTPVPGYSHHAYAEGYARIAEYIGREKSQEQSAPKEQKKLDTSKKISSNQPTPN